MSKKNDSQDSLQSLMESAASAAPNASVLDRIITLARANCDLFTDEAGKAYASFSNSRGIRETWGVETSAFRKTLNHWHYQACQKVAKKDVISESCEQLAGFAALEGVKHSVFIRTAYADDHYYLDLCNDDWSVVEISSAGWQVLPVSPVKFIRSDTMQPLPVPVDGGDINELWQLMNVSEEDRLLVLTWILDCYRQNTQKLVLELLGGHGRGKSETTRVLRGLIDPNTASLRRISRQDEALFVSAQANWILTYDNVSHLTDDQQDLLCQLCTGAAFVKRTAYSNADETVLSALRPQIINGITPVATRLDLIDRCISTELPPLLPEKRTSETDLKQRFVKAQPSLLGSLLQLLADALKRLPDVHIDELPRMADFALLGEAVCQVLESKLPFMAIFQRNSHALITSSLEGSPVANTLMAFCQQYGEGVVFSGIVSQLFHRLGSFKSDYHGWPKSPRGFGNVLRREQSALKLMGITVSFTGKQRQGRTVEIIYKPIDQSARHPPHAPMALSTVPVNAYGAQPSDQHTPERPDWPVSSAHGDCCAHREAENKSDDDEQIELAI
ncbi:hypothetical protein [Endozoicomonas sp. SESOKO1]|uniref:hypothetical protein n=1 Tax=Endozoicomonas sp. SESOKO1 TaxID=2828742 RepID=UPI002148AA36|nr:hypothetical protein [Endozoicomonas sp. SESOKO1]